MKRPPLVRNIISFGKFKGMNIRDPDIPDSYLRWFISVEPRTSYLGPWEAELARRTGKSVVPPPTRPHVVPPAPVTSPTKPTPPQLSPTAQENDEEDDNSPGTIYTQETVTEFLLEAYDRGYKQAEDILQPRIKALDLSDFTIHRLQNSLKQEPAKPPEKSDVTVLLTREQLQELILQSVSLGYSDAFERLGNRARSFNYWNLDNDQLYTFLMFGTGKVTLKEDDVSRVSKKNWYSEDNRKNFRR